MRFLYPRMQKLSTSNRYELLNKEDTQEDNTSSIQEEFKRKIKKPPYEGFLHINLGTKVNICNICGRVVAAPSVKTTPTPEVIRGVVAGGPNADAVAASPGAAAAAPPNGDYNIILNVTTTPIAVTTPIF